LVSPDAFWPDFVQNIATLNGLAGDGSGVIADADIVKIVSARIIILPPLNEKYIFR
jgi:hypothetical protein